MKADKDSIYTIRPDQSLMEAMEVLNKTGFHICFVLDSNHKLIGSITDGDVRRALLRGATIQSKVENFMHLNPKKIPEGLSLDEIIKEMNKWGIRQLPVVNAEGKIVAVETIELVMKRLQKSNPIILMAGGLGKRLSPLTDTVPKPLLKIDGVPILEHTIRRFKELGFYKFTISVKYKSDMIMEHFGDGKGFGVEIDYIKEEVPLGTCGGLSFIENRPTEPFFVMNGDILTRANFSNILNFHVKNDAFATMCVKEHSLEVPYGVVKSDGIKIASIEEKPRETTFINAGIYALSPGVFDFIEHGQFLDMPTLFMRLLKNNKNVVSCVVKDYWLDIGRIEDFHKAQIEYEKYYKP